MPVTATGALSPDELVLAMDEQRLVAVYQPCFDLRSGALVAVEALARVRAPGTDVLLPPSDFLPTAEASGLVRRLDGVIAEQAINQVARWRRLPGGRQLSVAVNTSVYDLDDERLPDRLISWATRAGLPLDALIVEVTETVLSLTGRGHEQVLARLDAAGCNVTLDDFGTGHCSVEYLQRFPVSGLKIDRSFVAELGRGGPAERLTEGLVRLCLSLGVHVVAEGIENEEQLEALRRLGCPFGQGYLMGRPMTAEQLEALLLDDQRPPLPAPPPVVAALPRPRPRPSRALLPVVTALVATVLLVLAVTVVQAHRSTSRSLAAAGQGKLAAVDALAAATIGARMTALGELVVAHSRREVTATAARTGDPAQQASVLEALRSATPMISSASLYAADGDLVALDPAAPSLYGKNFAFRDWYRGARESTGAYLSEPFQLVKAGSPWAVASAAAVRDDDGTVVGYLVATYELEGLQRLVGGFEAQHGISLTVVDRRGQVLAASPGSSVQGAGARTSDPRVLAAVGLGPSVPPAGDAQTQWTVAPVYGDGGVVLAEQPRSAALAGYSGQSGQDLLRLGCAVVVTLLLLGLLLVTDRRRRRLLHDLDRTSEELRQAGAWVSALLESTPTAVVVTGPDGVVRQANEACAQILDVDGSTLPGRPLTTWLTVSPDEPADGLAVVQLLGGRGGVRVLEVRTRTLRDPQGELVHVHSLTDVTSHRVEQERLHRQGRTDPLTGVANRRALQDVLDERLAAGPGPAGVDALVMLDLDGFKGVNDLLGHGTGDGLLVDVARALTQSVGADDLVARLGGDEFVVLVRLTATGDLLELEPCLRRAVREAAQRTTRGTALDVDVSIGDAVLGVDGTDLSSLLAAADARMYADKRLTRGGVPAPRSAPRA